MIWFLNERLLDREIRCSKYHTKKRTTTNGFYTLDASAIQSRVDLFVVSGSKGFNSLERHCRTEMVVNIGSDGLSLPMGWRADGYDESYTIDEAV